jgi:hypothetical protein
MTSQAVLYAPSSMIGSMLHTVPANTKSIFLLTTMSIAFVEPDRISKMAILILVSLPVPGPAFLYPNASGNENNVEKGMFWSTILIKVGFQSVTIKLVNNF